ncbi:unnamed protein product, partial [Polarella glacialis]
MCVSTVLDFLLERFRFFAARMAPGQLEPAAGQNAGKGAGKGAGKELEAAAGYCAGQVPIAAMMPTPKIPRQDGDASAIAFLDFNDEIQAQVLSFLPGWVSAQAQAALPSWRSILSCDSWWRTRCLRDFKAHLLPRTPAGVGAATWHAKYRQLNAAKKARTGTWCHRSRRHGLGDRVAQPQMFVGREGQKLFNYGGWSGRGPQNDLHWVPIDTLRSCAARSPLASAASGSGTTAEPWKFVRAEEHGTPAFHGGVQALTPLWFGSADTPSLKHIAATSAALAASCAAAGDKAVVSSGSEGFGSCLLFAFGGGQGSYRNEHNSWAVGVLHEGQGSDPAKVLWGRPKPARTEGADDDEEFYQPGARAAHSATYVPARLAGGLFPEGCVVVYCGHRQHVREELGSIDVLSLHDWRWQPIDHGQEAPEPRHGHSTTLLEVDGKGYLIVVGGGTGNILENFGVQDFYDAAVLEIATWNWLGKFRLDLEPGAAGPGRHHTACSGLLGQIFLFGGGQRPGGQVLLLDGEGLVRQALAGTSRRVALREVSSQISGSEREGGPAPALPTGRKMHGAACLLPWAPMLVVYGGWERGPHFDDLWVYAMGGDAEDLEGFECLLRSQGGQLPAQNE